ncbi:MAG: lactate utilization protein, partial [Acidobacteria bacterium]|nr:lactate utilization protein [Acidobacteriota bacterium]
MSAPAQHFLRSAAEKSADLVHRQIIRKGIDSYDIAVGRGHNRFHDYEAARQRCYEIKREAVNNLERYLLEFEEKVLARGGHVFWAADAEEARNYVADLATKRGVKKVVKSKSMVTEEIHLAGALEKVGIEVVETDLGEFIVQLRNEPPYHIVTPVMQLTKEQVAATFEEKLGTPPTDDASKLAGACRDACREQFAAAVMGITGGNFLVADVGMVALTENEGNARLSFSMPDVHLALVGIEKIIPKFADLALMWPMLSTSGTG